MKNRILFLIINFCMVTFLVANSRNPFDDVESSESYLESELQLERPVSPSMPGLTLIHQEKVSPPPPLLYFPHLDQQVQPMPKVQVPLIPPLLTEDRFKQLHSQYQKKRLEQKQLPFSEFRLNFPKNSYVNQQVQPMPNVQVPFILPLYTQDQFQQFYLQCQNKRLEQNQFQSSQFNNVSQGSISMQPFSIEEKGETRALNAQEKKAKAAVSAALERKNRKNFPCPVCKKYFLHEFHLNSHLDDMHRPHIGKYASMRRCLFKSRYSKNDAKK